MGDYSCRHSSETLTGSHIKRVRFYIRNKTFRLTYGDRVAYVDIIEFLAHLKAHGRFATVTAVQPPGGFGISAKKLL